MNFGFEYWADFRIFEYSDIRSHPYFLNYTKAWYWSQLCKWCNCGYNNTEMQWHSTDAGSAAYVGTAANDDDIDNHDTAKIDDN